MRGKWSVSGLGMLRVGLDDLTRLQFWHSRFQTCPTPTHDHYWDFTSEIIHGKLHNYRYAPAARGTLYNRWRIGCCPNDNIPIEGPFTAILELTSHEIYHAGQRYSQRAEEIHSTGFDDGTITLLTKTHFLDHKGVANVYGPFGSQYISAEPRPPTPEEMRWARDYYTSLGGDPLP